jgi:hypothetical protein
MESQSALSLPAKRGNKKQFLAKILWAIRPFSGIKFLGAGCEIWGGGLTLREGMAVPKSIGRIHLPLPFGLFIYFHYCT